MQKTPATGSRSNSHRIFVLTFWLENEDELADSDAWRFRLEEPRSGRRRGCVGIQNMVELLSNEIDDSRENIVDNEEKNK